MSSDRPASDSAPGAAPASGSNALLPAGLRDVLPPDADQAADVEETLRACFRSHGYARIKPPLMEFEGSLLAGPGAALERDTFRLMDPVSHRMMGLRSDLTVQIARIATTRLADAPRPLRISYAGDVTRVTGTAQRPERQFSQVGAELIGDATTAADVEVILLAIEALGETGLQGLSVDLSLPTLVPAVAAAAGIEGEAYARLARSLDRKDAATVARIAGGHAAIFEQLLDLCGPAGRGLAGLAKLDLPAAAEAEADRLATVAGEVAANAPEVALTIDPVENRGLEYHTGVSFTILRRGVRGELAAGGRYLAENPDGENEPATGVTLYLDTLLRALGPAASGDMVLLPAGTAREEGARLRAEGWVTVAALDAAADPATEARRLGCTHVLQDGAPVAV